MITTPESQNNKSILVTGALGFIGSHILHHYRKQGYSVVGITSGRNTSDIRLSSEDAQQCLYFFDIPSFLNSSLAKKSFHYIFHTASYGNYSWQENIYDNTQPYQDLALLLDWMSSQKDETKPLLIHLGSSSEYGTSLNFQDEHLDLQDSRPLSLYSSTKLAQSHLIRYYGYQKKVPCIHLRLFSIFGPLEHPLRLIPTVCKTILSSKDSKSSLKLENSLGYPNSLDFPESLDSKHNLLKFSHKKTQRDFVYIEDLLHAFDQILKNIQPHHYGQSFNISSGKPVCLEEIALWALKKKPFLEILWTKEVGKSWDLDQWSGNSQAFQKEFQWSIQTPFWTGLEKTLNFYQNHCKKLLLPESFNKSCSSIQKKIQTDNEHKFQENCLLEETRDLSIIITCYNHHKEIKKLFFDLKKEFENFNQNQSPSSKPLSYEILVIDDADPDNSFSHLQDLAKENPSLRLIRNPRNLGSQRSLLKGLFSSRGQALVTMDGDLQDPAFVVTAFVKKWQQGHLLVLGRRTQREESFFLNFCRKSFYRLWSLLSLHPVFLDVGDFSLVDRSLIRDLFDDPPFFFTWRSYRNNLPSCPVFCDYLRPSSPENKSSNSFLALIQWSLRFWTSSPNLLGWAILSVIFFTLLISPQRSLSFIFLVLLLLILFFQMILIELLHQSPSKIFKKTLFPSRTIQDEKGFNQVWAPSQSNLIRTQRRSQKILTSLKDSCIKNSYLKNTYFEDNSRTKYCVNKTDAEDSSAKNSCIKDSYVKDSWVKNCYVKNSFSPVLELGPGQGFLTELLIQEGYRVTAVDSSSFFIEGLEKKLFFKPSIKETLPEHVITLKKQEALDFLQSHNSRFSHCVGIGILHHLWKHPSWAQFLAQSLDSEGEIIFLEPNPHNPLARFIFNTPLGRYGMKLDPEESLKDQSSLLEDLRPYFHSITLEPFDWIYPGTPCFLIPFILDLEKRLPFFIKKYGAQSLLIQAKKKHNP
jgi:polyisoprenyl-phosphate glycosyltransferase